MWLRAAEKCQDARTYSMRILNTEHLAVEERTTLRAIVEDLKITVGFIERNRLKDNAAKGLPPEMVAPLDTLGEVLEGIRSRFQRQLMETNDAG